MQDHRKLRVWREAHDLAIDVRRACNQYPSRGFSRLKTQTTDAAESVVLTIVEGCGAATQKEFARFLDMCIKSSRELEEELELAKDHGALNLLRWRELTRRTIDIRKGVCVLRARVLATESPDDRSSKHERKPNNET